MITSAQYTNARFMLDVIMEAGDEPSLNLGETRELRVFELGDVSIILFGAVDERVLHEPDEDCPYDEHVAYGIVLPSGEISPPITSGTVNEHSLFGFNMWEAARPITADEVASVL